MATMRHTSPLGYSTAGQCGRRTEGPSSLAGTGALGMQANNAAQALGLRPWLAALPLRERRLRARLLMSAPNGGLSSVTAAIVARRGSIAAIAQSVGGRRTGRWGAIWMMAIPVKSPQSDVLAENRTLSSRWR